MIVTCDNCAGCKLHSPIDWQCHLVEANLGDHHVTQELDDSLAPTVPGEPMVPYNGPVEGALPVVRKAHLDTLLPQVPGVPMAEVLPSAALTIAEQVLEFLQDGSAFKVPGDPQGPVVRNLPTLQDGSAL